MSTGKGGGGGSPALNVLGEVLEPCGKDPVTGFFRDGYCRTDQTDAGAHVVCCQLTADFLEFSKNRGNDLTTPVPEFSFPGLKPGDNWCLCAMRWVEAYQEGKAPLVNLACTNIVTLEVVPLNILKEMSVKP